MTLYFESPETVFMVREESTSLESRHEYSYERSNRRGRAGNLGSFSVTERYDRMVFSPTWRGYPHPVEFTRIND